MKILLDTQCWLWMTSAPERFSPPARRLLADPGNARLLSAASAWEIAIKYALGKLRLPVPPEEYVPDRLVATRSTALAVDHEHALRVASLPPLHRDPFDRLLVAQAQTERLPLLTADPQLSGYDVEIIRA